MKRPLLTDLIRNNIFFDTCVYHMPGIELLLKIVPVDNVLFGSEMVGAVRGIDPETGHYYDDTKKYLDKATWLGAERQAENFRGERPEGVSPSETVGRVLLDPARSLS